MYNVLEKLRAGEPIEGRDRAIYDHGLVVILSQLHDEIDAETARAYGWPAGLSADAILHRLVALNRERAAEEAQGLVRWLRPEFQNPTAAPPPPPPRPSSPSARPPPPAAKPDWPRLLPEQIAAVRAALTTPARPPPPTSPAASAAPAPPASPPLLETLAALGHARLTADGRFTA